MVSAQLLRLIAFNMFSSFIPGRSISKVHLISGQAFVIFNKIDDIEMALDIFARKKTHDKFKAIKVFRSSEEQFQHHQDSMQPRITQRSPQNAHNSSMSMINTRQDSKHLDQTQSKYDSTHLIYVKGLPWIATKQEIVGFFHDMNILNGTNGIHFFIDNYKDNCAFIQLKERIDFPLPMRRQVNKDRGRVVSTGSHYTIQRIF